ncbi:hypothetical protein UPYG_G00064780 [Umbra pygmaea]|uniref:ZP domain-containing protein n=1 Tax=Umbra pygmaea TaxID=75934 RepID=A0ABD0XDU2_UMBPY
MVVKLVMVLLFLGHFQYTANAFSETSEEGNDLLTEGSTGDYELNPFLSTDIPYETLNKSQIVPKSARRRVSGSRLFESYPLTKASHRHSPLDYLRLPESVRIEASEEQTYLFKPEQNARPLPYWVKDILLATIPPITPAPSRGHWMEIMCHIDRMAVRIRKSIFTNPKAWKFVRLMSCPVNPAVADAEHFKFDYYLDGCGMEIASTPDRIYYSTVLKYEPKATGGILRELPFSVPLECSYNRFHRSYKVGFHPHLHGQTLFRALKANKAGVTIALHDRLWNELPADTVYPLGKPVYFEVRVTPGSRDQLVYINTCFVTASPDATATRKYTVIDNYGCMVDSLKTDTSRFISQPKKTSLRFSVGAFIFSEMVHQRYDTKKFYMHCEITMGSFRPTPSAKSCNYDPESKMWVELRSPVSVCACCDRRCPSPQSDRRNMLASRYWSMGGSGYED